MPFPHYHSPNQSDQMSVGDTNVGSAHLACYGKLVHNIPAMTPNKTLRLVRDFLRTLNQDIVYSGWPPAQLRLSLITDQFELALPAYLGAPLTSTQRTLFKSARTAIGSSQPHEAKALLLQLLPKLP